MERQEIREDLSAPAAAPRMYLSGGTVPRGLTLARVEKTLLEEAGAELEKTFNEWELESLSLRLTVEKGKVTAVGIEGYRGRTCREEVLEKIFRKLTFPGSISGTLAIELIYG